jgi:hypothetical protein
LATSPLLHGACAGGRRSLDFNYAQLTDALRAQDRASGSPSLACDAVRRSFLPYLDREIRAMQRSMKWIRPSLGGTASLLVALSGTLLLAQEQPAPPVPATPTVTLDSVNAKADAAALAGHNAWMLTSSALVLFMTAPGLAMFYGGLVRKKNVLSVVMQCLYLMALNTVIWGIYGYSLSFGGIDPSISGKTNPYIGNTDFLFMRNVERTWDAATNAPVDKMQGAIPRYTHMLFQGMFFIITLSTFFLRTRPP